MNNNMETLNYKPGQIIYSRSNDSWVYISVLRYTKPQNASGTMQLHTCCDLSIDGDDGSKSITFTRGNGTLFDVNTTFEEVREATNEEKIQLFDALVKAYKDYDLGWDKHFTDSTYLDILDWLAWEFDIELSSDVRSDASRPSPIEIAMYEIQDYIWDILCKETGNYQEKTVEQSKLVNLDKVEEFLESCMFNAVIIEDGKEVPDEIVVIRYKSVSELIDGLHKALEE